MPSIPAPNYQALFLLVQRHGVKGAIDTMHRVPSPRTFRLCQNELEELGLHEQSGELQVWVERFYGKKDKRRPPMPGDVKWYIAQSRGENDRPWARVPTTSLGIPKGGIVKGLFMKDHIQVWPGGKWDDNGES